MLGHNSGYNPALIARDNLDEAARDLLRRARDLCSSPAPDAITEHAEASVITGRIAALATVAKAIDAMHKETKAPHLAASRAIDAWRDEVRRPVDLLAQALKATLTDYQRVIAVREHQRRAEEAAIARQFAERAAAAESPAAKRADYLATSLEAAAAAPDAGMSRVRHRTGASASLRTTIDFRVTDEAAIPREFLILNESAVRAAVKAGRIIPGIETFEKQLTVVR